MNVSASSMPITLKGTEYQIAPLSDQASHRITQWIRSDLLSTIYLARDSVAEAGGNSDDFAQKMIHAALQVEWLDDNGSRAIRSDMGLARLLLESLSPTVPGITQAKCLELLKGHEAKELFWTTFLAVNDLLEVVESDQKKSRQQDVSGSEDRDVSNALGSSPTASGSSSKDDDDTNSCRRG